MSSYTDVGVQLLSRGSLVCGTDFGVCSQPGLSPWGGSGGEEGDGGMAGYQRSGQTCISPTETKRTYGCKEQGPLVGSTRFLAVYNKGLAQCRLPVAHQGLGQLGCHSRKKRKLSGGLNIF